MTSVRADETMQSIEEAIFATKTVATCGMVMARVAAHLNSQRNYAVVGLDIEVDLALKA